MYPKLFIVISIIFLCKLVTVKRSYKALFTYNVIGNVLMCTVLSLTSWIIKSWEDGSHFILVYFYFSLEHRHII